MGTYTIVIEGHGINHNGTPKDADEMGKAFVSALRASGHTEVKGYFVYGPKLATPLEATMSRGTGSKKLEPLAPLCDHKEWVNDKHGRYAQECKAEAVAGFIEGQELVTVRCQQHDTMPTVSGRDRIALRAVA